MLLQIILSKEAEKDFAGLTEREKKKVFKKFTLLRNQPYSGKKLVGKLKGLYSLRAWPYRIIYEVIKAKKITVHKIIHRQRAYRG